MGTLAHVLEASGIATVMIASVLSQAERLRPPRALYCEFPLGRPLGEPRDPGYQHRVLAAAFELLSRPAGPVLERFPDVIADDPVAEHVVCELPLRYDPSVHPAVDEARGLRPAFNRYVERGGLDMVGRAAGADSIPETLAAFALVAGGASWKESLPRDPVLLAQDVRGYYESAAAAIESAVPAARASDAWFFSVTAAGRVLLGAQRALREQGYPGWRTVVPYIHQEPDLRAEA